MLRVGSDLTVPAGVRADCLDVAHLADRLLTRGERRPPLARVRNRNSWTILFEDTPEPARFVPYLGQEAASWPPARPALFARRRKEIYEALHPETWNGVVGNGRPKVPQIDEATTVDRFTVDTAKRPDRDRGRLGRGGPYVLRLILSGLAMGLPVSVDWSGYWQRAAH